MEAEKVADATPAQTFYGRLKRFVNGETLAPVVSEVDPDPVIETPRQATLAQTAAATRRVRR